MSQQTKNLKAFNIGFGQTIYDESNLARKIADHYGAQFETIDCNNNSLAENYLKTLYHVEQPLANPNSIAKQILSQLVRSQGYKVCITGEGSDEIFGGYAYFKLERIWRMLNAVGREAQEGLKLQERFQKLEKRSEGLLWHRGSDWKTQLYWLGYPSFHQMRVEESSKVTEKLLTRRVIEQASYSTPWNYFQSEFEPSRFGGLDPFNSTKLITFNQLVNYIIPTLGDRVEMANSVECRTPFLDKDLVEFASTVPTEHFMDITQLREKRLLQKAFSDLLPEFMFKEHKHPFLSPNWSTFSKTSTGKQITSEFLSYESLKKTDIFNPRFIRTLKFYWRFFPKSAVVWKKVDVLIGMVLSTQVLHHLFVENEIPADSSFELQNRSPDQMSRLAPKLKTPSAFSQAPALL